MIRSNVSFLIKFIITSIVWVLVLGIPVGEQNLHYHAHKFILGNKLTKQAISKTETFRNNIENKWTTWYSSAMGSDEGAAQGNANKGRRF